MKKNRSIYHIKEAMEEKKPMSADVRNMEENLRRCRIKYLNFFM